MLLFILAVICFIAFVVMLLLKPSTETRYEYERDPETRQEQRVEKEVVIFSSRKWAPIPLGLGLIVLLFSTLTIIDGGSVGVVKTFGKYSDETLKPGFNLVAPWSDVSEISVRTETYTMSAKAEEGDVNGDDSIKIQTSDLITIPIEVSIPYQVDKSRATELIQEVGDDFVDKIIRPTARSVIRDEASNFSSEEFITSGRAKFAGNVLKALQKELGPKGINIQDVQVRDMNPPRELKDAANAKVKAEQDLIRARSEAETKRVNAQATADAQQILACGGTRVTDDAGNSVVVPNRGGACDQSQLTPAFLQQQYIEALKGLVDSPNNSTLILPTDQNLTPLLNVPPSK